jgi:uncharacterized protein YuzE
MPVTYDPETKAAYIYLRQPIRAGEAARTIGEAAPGVNLDFDADRPLIGIELLSPDLLHPDLMAIAVEPDASDETP